MHLHIQLDGVKLDTFPGKVGLTVFNQALPVHADDLSTCGKDCRLVLPIT